MILGFDRCVKDKWALGMGACHPPLQGLNHELLQLLTFSIPWKEFRVEIINEALYDLEKTNKKKWQNRFSDRYFQETIS